MIRLTPADEREQGRSLKLAPVGMMSSRSKSMPIPRALPGSAPLASRVIVQ